MHKVFNTSKLQLAFYPMLTNSFLHKQCKQEGAQLSSSAHSWGTLGSWGKCPMVYCNFQAPIYALRIEEVVPPVIGITEHSQGSRQPFLQSSLKVVSQKNLHHLNLLLCMGSALCQRQICSMLEQLSAQGMYLQEFPYKREKTAMDYRRLGRKQMLITFGCILFTASFLCAMCINGRSTYLKLNFVFNKDAPLHKVIVTDLFNWLAKLLFPFM